MPNVPSLSAKYGFQKPNDPRSLDLMNAAASSVLKELPDIIVAYGVSDEYRLFHPKLGSVDRLWMRSFVFDRACKLFDRRERYVQISTKPQTGLR